MLGSQGVLAQGADPKIDENFASDAIIVTAQKRSENIADVGLSITAITADSLDERGVVDVASLTRIEPSLQFSSTDMGTPVYTIRGVGFYEQALMAPPTVSLYQDQIPYPYPVMSAGALLDVERVEVLKGPQGTLYGQNATGGAVNFIAARPTSDFAAGLTATVARFGEVHLDGYVSGPVTEGVRMRLSAETDQGGAWQRSNTRDEELGDRRYWAARLLTEISPNEDISISINANMWRDESDAQASQLSGFVLLNPDAVSPAAPGDRLPNPTYLANGDYPSPIEDFLNNPISPMNSRAADWFPGASPRLDMKFQQISGRADIYLNDALTMTSLTSYQHFTSDNLYDITGVNTQTTVTRNSGKINSFFQELRLNQEIGDGRGNIQAGINYSHENGSELYDQNGLLTASYFTATGVPWTTLQNVKSSKSESTSIYASAAFPLMDTLKLNVGLRHTWTTSEASQCTLSFDRGLSDLVTGGAVVPGECYTFLPDFSNGLFTADLSEENTPWRVSLDWKPAPETLLYASVSRGFKAGSFPTTAATTFSQLQPAVQESLTSYEVGVKTDIFDRTISLTAAAFHYNYKDKQIFGRVIDNIFGPIFKLLNVPTSEADGAELGIVVRPAEGLTVDFAGTYIDTRVTSDFLNFNAYGDPIDFKGEKFPFTPEWSAVGGIRYERSLTRDWDAYAMARGSYQSETNSSFGAETGAVLHGYPSLTNKAYAILDLSLGATTADGRWKAEIWGRNVTNTYYWNTTSYLIDNVVRRTGRPATYGITVGFNY